MGDIKMNKKGYSLAGFAEIALFTVLILSIVVLITVDMNIKYGKSYDGSFGMVTNTTLSNYQDYQESLQSSIKTGEQQQNTITGVQITSTWSMIKLGIETTFNFVTGNWIAQIVGLLKLGAVGDILTLVFRILFMVSIGFIGIRLLMKVSP